MNKYLFYPLQVLTIFSVFIILVIFALGTLGPKFHPPQTDSNYNFEEHTSVEVQYLEEKWVWSIPSGDKFPTEVFLLIKSDLGKDLCKKLLAELADKNLKSLLVHSAYASTISNLKRVDPRLMFGMPPTNLVKWSFLSALFLGSLYPMDYDFIYIDKSVESIYRSRLRSEIKRRNVPVVSPGDFNS